MAAAGPRFVFGAPVYGVDVDANTRCGHYHGRQDVVALRFKCCGRWYPCRQCHDAGERHAAAVWPLPEHDARAVLCGACGYRLQIAEYLSAGAQCSYCGAAFNPGCANHYHLYFERPGG